MSDEMVVTDTKSRCRTSSGNGAERRFGAVERDVAVIASNYCTKEDLVRVELKMLDRFGRLDATLAELESRVVRCVFASVVSVAAVCFTAGKLL